MNDQLQTAKDWLGDLSKIVSRQKTKEDYEYAKKRTEALGYLINRVGELEKDIRRWEKSADSWAEKNTKLEEENERLYRIINRASERNIGYIEQNQRYKQALEFYANEENHIDPFLYTREDSIPVHDESKVNEDGGKIARQALTGDEP
ncbi:hypothetical protein [Oceanobacillus sp. FSL H7-0719]|uniref:hypothetical protein n=1 Tax=Oceanobacillus sp. FSL H7-0719 TaxID=2954507 RepID=UPI00324C5B0B